MYKEYDGYKWVVVFCMIIRPILPPTEKLDLVVVSETQCL